MSSCKYACCNEGVVQEVPRDWEHRVHGNQLVRFVQVAHRFLLRTQECQGDVQAVGVNCQKKHVSLENCLSNSASLLIRHFFVTGFQNFHPFTPGG